MCYPGERQPEYKLFWESPDFIEHVPCAKYLSTFSVFDGEAGEGTLFDLHINPMIERVLPCFKDKEAGHWQDQMILSKSHIY